MERLPAPTPVLDEVRDGFDLGHAMLGLRASGERPCAALTSALAAQLMATDPAGARRAATRMQTPLSPAHTRGLDPGCKALLAVEVGGATGRRWLAEAPPRPGFTAHAGVRACVRALAIGRTDVAARQAAQSEDETHVE